MSELWGVCFDLGLPFTLFFWVLRSGWKYGAFLGLSFLGVLCACRVAMVFFYLFLLFWGCGLWNCALTLLDIGVPVLLFSFGEANRGSKRI